MFFPYGETEITYLSQHDKRLGAAIAQIGPIQRAMDADLFSAVAYHILGQQISSRAQATVWGRMVELLGTVDAPHVLAAGAETLQSCGTTFKKAEYLLDFARQVDAGTFPLDELPALSDEEAIARLASLKGVGVWTAEMLLLHCLARPDIFSFGDLAIHRGLRMLYRHKTIDRERFERYRRRFSPYGSTASIYLWAISAGAIPDLTDPAQKPTRKGTAKKQPIQRKGATSHDQ